MRNAPSGGNSLRPHRLPCRPPPLQLLDRAASAQARVEHARAAAELTARHHLDLAAATFEVLKGIFGNKGPCALPRERVLAELRARSTSKSGLSHADAAEQLALMLRLLPSWVRVDHPPGVALADMRVLVRIHRRTPWPELRQQLLGRVAAARAEAVPAAGADAEAAAAAEAADLAAAALGAAVARAEAAAAGVAGAGSGAGSDSSGLDTDSDAEAGAGPSGGCAAAAAGTAPAPAEDAATGADAAAAAPKKGPATPEGLAACLKARVWGQQKPADA